jgi:hypothetical protein
MLARWLVSNCGCDVRAKNLYGKLAQQIAVDNGNFALARCLQELSDSSTNSSAGNVGIARKFPLLSAPIRLLGFTYLSLHLIKMCRVSR